jgi:hypothetical protein
MEVLTLTNDECSVAKTITAKCPMTTQGEKKKNPVIQKLFTKHQG